MAQVEIAALIAAVRAGRHLISFPTDTVPALAARPDAADLIFTAKQRQADKPLILMAATAEALWPYVDSTHPGWPIWQQIAHRYWPGAVTLVLPASPNLPKVMNPLDATSIGLRIPHWLPALALLQQTGPLATTSVNVSGQPALLHLAEINAQFPDVLTPRPHHWQLPHLPLGDTVLPSTVVKWTESGWQVLRQGSVEFEA